MSLKINLERHFPPIPHTMEIYTFGLFVHYSEKYNPSVMFKGLDVMKWCKACKLPEEETMIWVLKYGHKLPQSVDEIEGYQSE